MDHISPQDLSLSLDCMSVSQHPNVLTGTASWTHIPLEFPNSGPSSTYSGSPARSDLSLPVIAPRPQHAPAGMTFDMWQDKALPTHVAVAGVDMGAVPGLEMLFDAYC